MLYKSSRGAEGLMTSAYAIKMGLAEDGGLYIPAQIPKFTQEDIQEMVEMDYHTLTVKILKEFLTDYTYLELVSATDAAYSEKKFGAKPVKMQILSNSTGVYELWHGPTCAFKDMALQLMPQLLTRALEKTGEDKKVVILVATSGDTGKAALEGFKNVEGTEIIVFYPSEGVSPAQQLQMTTTEGNNVKVFGIKGNFDDAQRAVKKLFVDADFAKELADGGFILSSANSINWGRLVPQIVYYFSAYCDAIKNDVIQFGDKVDFAVPTGNFGDILAGYYAKEMGLPIHKLICASNSNDVLTEFINTGVYNKNREFVKTISPSMDILVSSNLERLLYHMLNLDGAKVTEYMNDLQSKGTYNIPGKIMEKIRNVFAGYKVTEQETLDRMQLTHAVKNYLVDPHTAVALEAANRYQNDNPTDKHFCIVLSTANPYKFSKDVLQAVDKDYVSQTVESDMQHLQEKTGMEIPAPLQGLAKKPLLHQDIIEVGEMKEKIKGFLMRNA